jgi:WD40 repeat protein
MKEIAQIGGGILYDAILSADQQKLLAVFSNAVKIYNVNTLEEMSSCSLEISEVPYASTKSWAGTAHAFSQDGAIFVFLGINSVEIWNIKECSLIQTFVLDQQLADCAYQVSQLDLRISPDNQIVALSVNGRNCGYQPQVRWIWKVSDGSLLLKDSGRAIAFSADGSMIATGGSGYQPISLWSTSDFELIRSLPGQNNTLDLFFLPDGNLLSCYENWIWTWEIDSGKVLKQIPNRDNMKCNLMIINGEVLILTANKLWRLRDEKYIPAPDGHTVDNISPDGKTLFSRFWDNSTKQIVSRLWRLDDDKLLETFIDAIFI